MSENLYFYRGLEEKLPTSGIKVGGLYHCTDTGNTYRGISSTEYELYSSTINTRTGGLVTFKSNLDNNNLTVISYVDNNVSNDKTVNLYQICGKNIFNKLDQRYAIYYSTTRDTF